MIFSSEPEREQERISFLHAFFEKGMDRNQRAMSTVQAKSASPVNGSISTRRTSAIWLQLHRKRHSQRNCCSHAARLLTGSNVMLTWFVPFVMMNLVNAQPPPPPTQLSVTLVRTTQVTLVWNPVNGASAYLVLKSYSPDGVFVPAVEVRSPPLLVPNSTAVISSLVTGRIVYLRVASGDEAGNFNSNMSGAIAATPLGPPTQPVTNLNVLSYNSTAVTVSWQLPGASAVAGPMPTVFSVQYTCAGATVTRYPVEFEGPSGLIVPVGGITLDLSCKFVVISRNLNFYTVNPWAITTVPAGLNQFSSELTYLMLSPPGLVSSLTATAATLTSITVTWAAAPRALLYRTLYARVFPDGSEGPKTVSTTDQTLLAATVNGLVVGQTYRITVEARNGHTAGYSDGAWIQLNVEDVPAAPTVSITAVTATTVQVTWIAPFSTQSLRFEVTRQPVDLSSAAVTDAVAGGTAVSLSVMSYTIGSLATGVPVRISVRASNLYGWGSYGSVTVTPFAEPSSPPSLVSVALDVSSPQSAANVSWSSVQFASFYRVFVQLQFSNGTWSPATEVRQQYTLTWALVRGLNAVTTYRFRVYAANPAGSDAVGTLSSTVTTLPVRQPALAVQNLTCTGATATSLEFTWTQDPQEFAISEAYIIEVSTTDTFRPANTTILPEVIKNFSSAGVSVANISQLALLTRYFVRVRPRSANASAYFGVPNATASGVPAQAPSRAVTSLEVISIKFGRASLRWDVITGQQVTYYRILANIAGTSSTLVSLEVAQPLPEAAGKLNADVLGLTERLSYDFIVTARSLNVAGYTGVPFSIARDVSFMGLPAPPVGLRVTFLTHDAVSLAWDRASSFPPATSFQVQWRIGKVRFSSHDIPTTADTSYSVTGLLRGATYEFRVLGGTLAGFESTGSATVLATPTFRPLAAQRIRIISIGSGSVSFEWTPSAYPKAFSYLVRYGQDNMTAVTRTSSFTASGLTPGVPVTFTVFARNVNSLGYETTGVSATLTPIDPPGPVTTLRVTGVTTTAVYLGFSAAELANVTAYKAQYKRLQDTLWIDQPERICREDAQALALPPTCPTDFQVSPLVLGVQYEVRLLSRNANQIGYREIGTVVRAVPIFRPTRPATNLHVLWLSTTQVTLSFTLPDGIDAPTAYKAVYRQVNTSAANESLSAEVSSVQPDITVGGLQLGVQYTFQVIGRNLNTEGYLDAVRSLSIVASPLPKPPRVGEATVTGVTATSVSLSWTPPAGPVTLYRIDVADDTALVNGVRQRLSDFGLAPRWTVSGYTNVSSYTVRSSGNVTLTSGLPVLVRVVARNLNIEGFGEGTASRATPRDAPLNPPTAFIVRNVTTGSVMLEWRPPVDYIEGDEMITKYKLEGCARNCGSDSLFPAVGSVGDKFYVLGGAEYEWTGQIWALTGNSFWRVVAILPYWVLEYNVTRVDNSLLVVNANYQFRVSAGNMNSESYGPLAVITEATPVNIPGAPREVVASNPKNSEFALNFVPPLEINGTGKAAFYRVQVTNVLSGMSYDYPDILYETSAVLKGFLFGTVYSVKVFSGNLNGFENVGTVSYVTVTTTAQPCTTACCASGASCRCCGLGYSRVQSGSMTVFWTAQSNLEQLQYRVDQRIFGSQAAFTMYALVYGSEVTISGLDFQFVGYQFQIRGGQRLANTLDAETSAVQIVVPVIEPVRRDVSLSADNVSSTSISVSWRRPYTSTDVMEISYLVQVSTDGFADGAMRNTQEYGPIRDRASLERLTLEAVGLIAGVTYQLRVKTLTPFISSWAAAATSSIVTAVPSPQPTSVTNLVASAVTLNSILFTWQPPPGFTITSYLVSWDPNPNSTVISGVSSSFNLTRLAPGIIYTLRVRARNLNWRGYEAGVTTTGTPQSTPLAPQSTRLSAVLQDGVDLRWDPPPGGPPVTAYLVQCRSLQDPSADFMMLATTNCLSGPVSSGAPFIPVGQPLSTDARTVRVQGISISRTYQFRVCSQGLSIAGLVCGGYVTATPSDPINPVTARLDSVTSDSITVSWSPAVSSLVWNFLPLYASPGNDLFCMTGNVDQLKAACLQNAACVGFSTDGCLKAILPGDASLVAYTSPSFSVGECCTGVNAGLGCTSSGADLRPAPACGCQCRGLFRKEVRYLLQMSVPPGPFANVRLEGWGVEGGSDGFSLSASRVPGCNACADCPASCVTVKSLSFGVPYELRVFVRDLQGQGFSGQSSNIISAIPRLQPAVAVSDLTLVYTTATRIVVSWTGLQAQDDSITAYKLQASLDGVTWPEALSGITLDEINHLGTGTRHEGSAGLLSAGTAYYIRVRARNYNSAGYVGVPGSNVVRATPYAQIAPIQGLAAIEVSACLNATCGCACCAANLCRGLGTVTLTWQAALGPVTFYRIQVAPVAAGVIGAYTISLDVDPSQVRAIVPGLSLGVDYAFKVQGGSTHLTPFFADCTAITPPGTPCPSIVRASPYTTPTTSVQDTLQSIAVSPNSVTLRWVGIASEPVTLYRVAFGTQVWAPAARVYSEVTHTTSVQATIKGLSTGVPYFFTVTPRNLNPGGYLSCPTTAPGVSATHEGQGTYLVTWQAPTWQLPITSYAVWVRLNATNSEYALVSTLQLPYTSSPLESRVQGLSATAAYSFLVTPNAPPCALIGPIVPTPQAPAVPSFVAVAASPTSVTVTWSEPPSVTQDAAEVDFYELALSACIQGSNATCVPGNYTVVGRVASPLIYTFTGLTKLVFYSFRIQAVNTFAVPAGPPSYTVAAPIDVPSAPPRNVSIVSRNNLRGQAYGASVRLSWLPPLLSRNETNVTRYRVFYWEAEHTECFLRGSHLGPVPCANVTQFPSTFTQTQGEITGLRPATSYAFKVYAGNLNGYDALGSVPAGPFMTSNLPASVTSLTIMSVTSSQVTLGWVLPSNPSASHILLQVIKDTKVNFSLPITCTSASPCPSSYTFTGLQTGQLYTFVVYTGAANDALMEYAPDRYSTTVGSYSGVASINGGPFQVINPPQNVMVTSWTASSVSLSFTAPALASLKGPLLGFTITASVGGGAFQATSAAGMLPPTTRTVTITAIGGVPLQTYDGTAATDYVVRVTAINNAGSSSTDVSQVRLHAAPSQVLSLREAIGPTLARSVNVQWTQPSRGAVAGTGFEYLVEVSDDDGASYFVTHRLPLGSTSATISMIPSAVPRALRPGSTYLVRIAARNLNTAGFGPYASLRVVTALQPSQVTDLRVAAVSSSSAFLTWRAPLAAYPVPPVPALPALALKYDLHVSLYKAIPKFVPLGGVLQQLSGNVATVPLAAVTSALVAYGQDIRESPSRFYIRIIPSNAAGDTQRPAELLDVEYADVPPSAPSSFTLDFLSTSSAVLSWIPPPPPLLALLRGYRVRVSRDGLSYDDASLAPARQDNSTSSVASLGTPLFGLNASAGSKLWLQLVLEGKAGVSLRHASVGPALQVNSTLGAPSLSANSVADSWVALQWDVPLAPVLRWQLTYSPQGGAAGPRGTLSALTSQANVSGLPTGVPFVFTVRAMTLVGQGDASSIVATPTGPPSSPTGLAIFSEDVTGGSVMLTWDGSVSSQREGVAYRVTYAVVNSDGHAGPAQVAAAGLVSAQLQITGLSSGILYLFTVQTRSLHVSGYALPSTLTHTLAGVPSAPQNVTLVSIASTSLTLRIIPPSSGARVLRFRITCTPTAGGTAIVQYAKIASEGLVAVGGLAAGGQYNVQTSACGVAGCTAFATISGIRTAPNQPVSFRAVSTTATTVSLSWSAPAPTNLAYTYRLRFRTVDLSIVATFVTSEGRIIVAGSPSSVSLLYGTWSAYLASDVSGTGTTATITGLTKNTAYQFSLEAVFSSISSLAVVYVARPTDQPGSVDTNSFIVSPDAQQGVMNNSLTVQWSLPGGSEVTTYRVSYWPLSSPSAVTSIEVGFRDRNSLVDGTGTNYLTLTNVTKYVSYNLRVQSRNLNILGYEAGVTMDFTLLNNLAAVPVDQPGRVLSLAVSDSTVSSVTLSWLAPPSPSPFFNANLKYRMLFAPVAIAPNGTMSLLSNEVVVGSGISATTLVVGSLSLGSLYRFRVQARNNNALGYEAGAAIVAVPVAACVSTGCVVRNVRKAAYSGELFFGTSSGVSVTIMWDPPVDATAPYNAYFYKVELVTGSTVTLVTTLNSDISTTELRMSALPGFPPAQLSMNTAYTLRVTARNANRAGYGAPLSVTITAYDQPTSLTAGPVVVRITLTAVTLQWVVPAGVVPSDEYTYKLSFKLAGSEGIWLGPAGSDGLVVPGSVAQSTVQGTIDGLQLGQLYEFKVFVRNLHENGYEGQGSPTVTSGPRPPPSPPQNVRLTAVTDTSVTVAWDAPQGASSATVYKVVVGSSASDRSNTTVVSAAQVFSRTITGLIEGRTLILTLSCEDVSGLSLHVQVPVRPYSAAPGPPNLIVQTMSTGNTALTWDTPSSVTSNNLVVVGLSLVGYQVEVRTPLGDPAGVWTLLGQTADRSFVHIGVAARTVTLEYAVSALIAQNASFGAVTSPGQRSFAQVYFGQAPEWDNSTIPDGSLLIVPRNGVLDVLLKAVAFDQLSVNLIFRVIGSLPPTATWGVPIASSSAAGLSLIQNLSLTYSADLAGSRYPVCVTARDANGLETPQRCWTLSIPLPSPQIVSPPNGARFTARLGCLLSVYVTCEDHTSENLTAYAALSKRFSASVALLSVSSSSRYVVQEGLPLPDGAALVSKDASTTANPSTSALEWRPSKGQEGFVYTLCFVAAKVRQEQSSVCVHVDVVRCQFCAQAGDSLQAMAKIFHTTWMEIWSGNHMIRDPDMVDVNEVLTLGPTYVVRAGDDLDHLADRFGVPLSDMLLWNPDVDHPAAKSISYQLIELQELCVIPQTCVYAAHITTSSDYVGSAV